MHRWISAFSKRVCPQLAGVCQATGARTVASYTVIQSRSFGQTGLVPIIASRNYEIKNKPVSIFCVGEVLKLQKRGMFIQTQSTPNPESLMFVPGRSVLESGSKNFENARAAMASPLAKKIFAIEGIKGVFFGSDFVTVTKEVEEDWTALKPQVFAAIMDFFASGQSILMDGEEVLASDTAILDTDSEVVAMLKELLDTRIRPAVQDDGGDIAFRGFDETTGYVYLEMQGACSGCPSSSVTLKSGIENMLMHYIPEVKAVVEYEDGMDLVSDAPFKKLEDHLSN